MAKRLLRSAGASLFEVLVSMSIVGILAAIAVPSAVGLRGGHERAGARQMFETDILRASSRAAALGVRVVLTLSADGHRYSAGPDYLPHESPVASETIEIMRELPRSVTLSPMQSVIFDSRGFVTNADGDLSEAYLVLSQDGTAYTNVTVTTTAGVLFE